MSLSVLQSASGGTDATVSATSRAVAFSSSVTVGSSIIAIILSRFPITAVSDSKGNTYHLDVQKLASGANIAFWRSSGVATGGSSFTVTATAGSFAGPIALGIVEVSGSLDFSGSASGSGLNNAPTITFSDTLSEAYCLAAFNAGPVSGTIPTSPASWTSRVKSSLMQLCEGKDRIFSSPQGSVTATWALGSGLSWASLAAVYAATATPPPTPVPVADMPGPHWPPIPGSPWALLAMRSPQPTPPASPSVTVSPVRQVLIPAVTDMLSQQARQQRADRLASLILNSLSRAGIIHRTGESSFVIRAGGIQAARSPAVTDDASAGVNVGTAFVDNTDTSVPRLYICSDNTVGAAVWQELQVIGISGVPSGGATGSFPG